MARRDAWSLVRAVVIALAVAASTAAAGSAVNVRDRVALVEARQHEAEALQAQQNREILRRLDAIEVYLKEKLP